MVVVAALAVVTVVVDAGGRATVACSDPAGKAYLADCFIQVHLACACINVPSIHSCHMQLDTRVESKILYVHNISFELGSSLKSRLVTDIRPEIQESVSNKRNLYF